jgi:hypothetical protein
MTTTTTQLEKAIAKQTEALRALADVLVAHGAPAGAPFTWFTVPSLGAMISLDPATASDWAITLVHAIFREPRLPGAVTTATKGVGNAARGVRRALAHAEASASRRLAA